MKRIFFLFLTALAFYYCQHTGSDKKYTLDCYVRYLATDMRYKAEATVRNTGPNPQAVEAPWPLMYQGANMDLKQLPSTAYKFEKPGAYREDQEFSWTDEKGETTRFNIKMHKVGSFGFDGGDISITRPATFRWEGPGLEKGEVLVFIWENTALRKTVPMEIYNTSGKSLIEFPAAQLAKLEPGTWTLYLVRKKLAKAEFNGVSASGIVEYYSATDTIEVK
ncbi:MAG: hypothetical protein KDC70_03480 [Saprospiraceae bacterium]|nr:hypothetical protein [Saprospiraceae bacterium]